MSSAARAKVVAPEMRECRFCHGLYPVRTGEHPRRCCCYRPVCETARERLRKRPRPHPSSSNP